MIGLVLKNSMSFIFSISICFFGHIILIKLLDELLKINGFGIEFSPCLLGLPAGVVLIPQIKFFICMSE